MKTIEFFCQKLLVKSASNQLLESKAIKRIQSFLKEHNLKTHRKEINLEELVCLALKKVKNTEQKNKLKKVVVDTLRLQQNRNKDNKQRTVSGYFDHIV